MSDCAKDRSLCDFEVERVTDWGTQGTNIPYVVVDLYCEDCDCSSYTSCSWEVEPEELEVYDE